MLVHCVGRGVGGVGDGVYEGLFPGCMYIRRFLKNSVIYQKKKSNLLGVNDVSKQCKGTMQRNV